MANDFVHADIFNTIFIYPADNLLFPSFFCFSVLANLLQPALRPDSDDCFAAFQHVIITATFMKKLKKTLAKLID